MAELALEISGLRKSFGALAVTDSVDLAVRAGEFHALIGPNGAGKTTLMNQISGVLMPTSGAIRLKGRDITHLSISARARLGVARTFQISSILPESTVLDNVRLSAQARAGSSFRFWDNAATRRIATDRAMAALESVGLSSRADAIAGSLSHGEKRSVEIALALVLDPALLLLDEPMAGTGHDEAARISDLLQALKGRYAIILVEHDMQAVFQLADTISVLVYGKVVASGAPAQIRDNQDVRAAYLGDEEIA